MPIMGSRLEKNSNNVRKRIEGHTFEDERGEEYEASKFGGFGDYMRRKKIKLQNLDAEIRARSTENPTIFRGIVAHVNGYTQPSLNDLHHLIVSHGGGFQQYLDGKTAVTHVIAAHLTPKKKVEFARYRIVKPAWIVDSVEAGKLLPWDSYRVVDEGVTQKVLGFQNGNFTSQINTQRQGYRDQTDTSWYTSQVRPIAQDVGNTEVDDIPDEDGEEELDISPEINESFGIDDETLQAMAESEMLQMEEQQDPMIRPESDDRAFPSNNSENHDMADQIPITSDVEAAHPFQQGGVGPDQHDNDENAPDPNMKSPEKRKLTAEEHNAILLSNPHLAKSSVANPDFINQYYRESRLHHLSTWKAELKAQLQARTQEKASSQKARQKRAQGARRYIMHIDFDSFFAAVSLRSHPELADQPVVIAHGSGPSSEIASCNYPARKYGVKNGMWMKTALGLCANLKVLPYEYKSYEEASRHFYDSILAVDGIVQSISIDEALLDVSDQCIKAGGSDGRAISEDSIYREQHRAEELATEIRDLVRKKTSCEVSVGIGNNILLAKVALRKAKPAGQHLLKPEEMLDFIGELVVTDLPGVAWSLGKKLEEIGVKYVKDIRSLNKERLINTLGPKTGEKLWDYSRGIDRQEVGEQTIRKSVSAEINWGIRFVTQQQAEEFVQCLCEELSRRLLEALVKGKQLTMKIMRKAADAGLDPPKSLGHGKCDTFNKSVVLGVATNDKSILGREAVSILRSYGFPPGELRGLGVQMQKLEPLKPSNLPGDKLADSSQRRLHFKKPESNPTGVSGQVQMPISKSPGPSDPIEEILTPEKSRVESKIPGVLMNHTNGEDDSRHKPLNIGGTQFLMPTQIDPSVLDELPSDIRSKLIPKQKSIFDSIARPESPQLNKSRSASPHVSDSELGLPDQSELDPEIFEALPEDVKQELLAHYKMKQKSNINRQTQQVLPQSPRKAKPIPINKKLTTTPTKKSKTTSLLTKGRSKTSSKGSTLTQSNFIGNPSKMDEETDATQNFDEEISQSFLDELPEDIRLEILADQKRNRMKSRSGLNFTATRRKLKSSTLGTDSEALRGQQKLHLDPHPPRPTFTSKKLSTLSELRNAMSAWVQEFSTPGEEGPFIEDVQALGQYLGKVVSDECDMSKAVAVVDWIEYTLGNRVIQDEKTKSAWKDAVSHVKGDIQSAVHNRGLPPLEFGKS